MLERKDFEPQFSWELSCIPHLLLVGSREEGDIRTVSKETPGFATSFSFACKQLSKVLNICRFQWDFSKTKIGKPPGVSEYSVSSVINTGDI